MLPEQRAKAACAWRAAGEIPMRKLKMHSPDLAQDNIARIRELFPHCVTEALDDKGQVARKVDFDLLRQALADDLVEGPQERYRLDWPGKRQAMLAVSAPIRGSLRPCREESVDFDTTENLYIEGDNLEVLKLLQESYLRQVRMIYIDPPYNTGSDFLYKDDFAEEAGEFLRRDGQYGDGGARMVQNLESNGRFHSEWLSMMYKRLRIARNLLTDDGVIFISIDDNEAENMKNICNEIFGYENFVTQFVWRRSGSGGLRGIFPVATHEYVISYCKNKSSVTKQWLAPYTQCSLDAFIHEDERGKYKIQALYLTSIQQTEGQSYFIDLPDGTKAKPKIGVGAWRYIKKTYLRELEDGNIIFKKSISSPLILENGNKAKYNIYTKQYMSDQGTNPATIFPDDIVGQTRAARAELKSLFRKDCFAYAKPSALIKYLLDLINIEHADIILDFFSGAATTAHAVMQRNAEDGGKRKFIMVQLPEVCPPDSEAAKAGYRNICEIGKERIRRAGKKIRAEKPLAAQNLDVGFRVLKARPSCMAEVYYTPDDTKQEQCAICDNIKPDATQEDLLFQVLTDWGVALHLPIALKTIRGKKVYFVDGDSLAACFDSGVNEEFIKELAGRKPLRVVFRDAGFVDDAARINAEQIFRRLSPDTGVRVL